jgi:hypothetical protein
MVGWYNGLLAPSHRAKPPSQLPFAAGQPWSFHPNVTNTSRIPLIIKLKTSQYITTAFVYQSHQLSVCCVRTHHLSLVATIGVLDSNIQMIEVAFSFIYSASHIQRMAKVGRFEHSSALKGPSQPPSPLPSPSLKQKSTPIKPKVFECVRCTTSRGGYVDLDRLKATSQPSGMPRGQRLDPKPLIYN